ncbi:MAG: AAA family ATPase, partial [Actinomycetota bacterium]|nr:AAA family ATPase [Actinomycetota bacterium]
MAAGLAPVPVTPGEPFVGRDDGLASIAAAIAGAAVGHGSIVLITGEAGIGKTRLAEEAVRSANDDRLVLWGSCAEGDGVPPFWPWAEALRPLVGSIPMPPEVVALLPGLAPPGAVRTPVADEIRFRAFNLVADLLDDLGRRRPLIVVLDDLHWADPSSVELLRVVARRIGTAHVTVVATYRDTEVGLDHPLHGVLGELARNGPRLALAGLAVEQVAQLLAGTDGAVDPELADAVTSRTGGNPFFVREVGRSGRGLSDVPPAVRDVLHARMEHLSAESRRTLECAAVAGHVDPVLIAGALDEEPLAVLDAVDELVARGLLVSGRGAAATFAHALVRETALAVLPARRTVELHGRLAGVIEARSGASDVEAIAHHRVRSAALDPIAAVRWAAAAGAAAQRQLAFEQAARWFERAVALAPAGSTTQAELLVDLADSAGRTTAGLARGRAAASVAADIARTAGDGELLARAAISFGGPFLGILTAGFAEAEPVVLAEEALAALPPDPSLLRVRLLARVATGLGYTPEHQRALQCAGESLAAARAVGDDEGLIEAFTAVTSIWDPATDEAAEALLDELAAVSQRRRSREGMVTVTVNRCLLALDHGDRGGLERHVAQLTLLLRELHLPVHGAYIGLFRAMLHRLDGRYGEAEAELLTAMAGLGDQAEHFVPGAAHLMVVWNEQDRLGEILDEARALFGSASFVGVPSGRVVLAYIEAVAGNRSVAAGVLPDLASSWESTQRDPNWLMGLAWACRTAVVVGDRASAALLLELGRPYASRSVFTAAGTITLGVLGMWLAEAAILLDRHDEAAGLLDVAERHYRGLQDRGHLVECELLRGRSAMASGRPDGFAILGAAASSAEALGMVRVARLAREAAS